MAAHLRVTMEVLTIVRMARLPRFCWMATALAVLLCVLPAPAQVSVTPEIIAFSQPVGGPESFGQLIVLDGPAGETWTAGEQTFSGRCGNPPLLLSDTSGHEVSSGTLPQTLWLNPQPYCLNVSVPAGEYTASIPITAKSGSAVIRAAFLVKHPVQSYPYLNPKGVRDEALAPRCFNSRTLYPALDTCVPEAAMPGGGFQLPAYGSAFIESTFGAQVRVLAGPLAAHNYSGQTAFNADEKLIYLLADITKPAVEIRDVATNTIRYTGECAPYTADFLWDPRVPNVAYYPGGQSLWKLVLGSNGACTKEPVLTLADTQPYNGYDYLSAGGRGKMSKDGRIALRYLRGAGPRWTLGLFDVNTRSLAEVDLTPYITMYSIDPLAMSRTALLPSVGVDAATNKRYVGVVVSPARAWYSQIGDDPTAPLVLESVGPAAHIMTISPDGDRSPHCTVAKSRIGGCVGSSHSDTAEGPDGTQYLVEAVDIAAASGAGRFLAALRINSGDLMTTPVEAGGGLYRLLWFTPYADPHIGCGYVPYCVLSTSNFSFQPAWTVVGASGSPIRVRLRKEDGGPVPVSSLRAGAQVLLAGIEGNTNANGVHTVASVEVNGNDGVITLEPTSTSNAAYTPNTGAATINTPVGELPFSSDLLLLRIPTGEARRVAKTRSVVYSAGYRTANGYWQQARACLGPSGQTIAFDSSYGFLDQSYLSVLQTGIPPVASSGTIDAEQHDATGRIASVETTLVDASIRYTVSSGSTCLTEVSSDASFADTIYRESDSPGSEERGITLTGLNPETQYFVRQTCDNATAAQTRFTTKGRRQPPRR